jgi:hypothetical protein
VNQSTQTGKKMNLTIEEIKIADYFGEKLDIDGMITVAERLQAEEYNIQYSPFVKSNLHYQNKVLI